MLLFLYKYCKIFGVKYLKNNIIFIQMWIKKLFKGIENIMSIFCFSKDIKNEYLKLAKVAYGGEFYLGLKNYKLKEVEFENSKIKKYTDNLLSKKGINEFYSYKNVDTGFTANLFENIKTKELVIAYRGTERFGLGENESDLPSMMCDIYTDLNLLSGNYDEHFKDGWDFYKAVKKQNPDRKIIVIGHSLGGAIAQIVAAKEYTINRKKIETYTYNAPGCRHLLDVYDCNTTYSYSFITNYAVMNDWCGMFGQHIGQTYVIKPIALRKVDMSNNTEVVNNVLFTVHEGIFNYSKELMGKIYKKPKNFNQNEGLSLWYFDENNPMREYSNLSECINANFPQFNLSGMDDAANSIGQKAEEFFKNNIPEEIQNSGIAVAIKNATESLSQAGNDMINNFMNNNTITVAIKSFDMIFSELSVESLNKANEIIKRM